VQLLPCPFCGERDETEFYFLGEPKARPEPAESVTDEAWGAYLWSRANPRGASREVWLHLTCLESFFLTRDTATNAVVAGEAFPGRTS
jgi:sarcosine oxidase subunit delta